MATPLSYTGQPSAAGVLVYTAPAGGALVRGIRAVNPTGTARWLRLGKGGTGDAQLLLPQWSVDAGGLVEDDTLISLAGGETIYARSELDATVTLTLSGMAL